MLILLFSSVKGLKSRRSFIVFVFVMAFVFFFVAQGLSPHYSDKMSNDYILDIYIARNSSNLWIPNFLSTMSWWGSWTGTHWRSATPQCPTWPSRWTNTTLGGFLFCKSLKFQIWHAAKLFPFAHWFQNCFCFCSRTFPSHVCNFFLL